MNVPHFETEAELDALVTLLLESYLDDTPVSFSTRVTTGVHKGEQLVVVDVKVKTIRTDGDSNAFQYQFTIPNFDLQWHSESK